MGFWSSLYNSIRMMRIAEEMIRGDPQDETNAFQWDHVRLNLPGTPSYTPSEAWITKRQRDRTLASDFVTFVDDVRIGAQGEERTQHAGHTVSTRECMHIQLCND